MIAPAAFRSAMLKNSAAVLAVLAVAGAAPALTAVGAAPALTAVGAAPALTAVGAAPALAAIGAAPVETVAPPAVTVVRAKAGALAETVALTGNLAPREEVLVNPQIDGLALTKILAEEGDRVVAGQALAELSHDVLDAELAQNAAQIDRAEAAVAQARSSIEEAEATRVQADAAFARTRELVTTGAASRETFDQRQQAAQVGVARAANARDALRVASADRALAQAQRQELAVRLARTQIRAPVAGVVSRRTARLGAVVGMAGDPLFRIIEDGAIELEADAPENRLGRLRPGQPAMIDFSSTMFPAHVRLVSPEVNRTSRLGRVRIAFDQDAGEITRKVTLAIGAFARARVETARMTGEILPLSAVLFESDGPKLQVVHDGLVETRPVAIGLRDGGMALITAGVAEGEEVVSLSATFVRGGDRVTPVLDGR